MRKIDPFIVDNYIVRIYRRDEEDLRKIAGIVEQVGTEEKRSFHSLDELWTILSVAKGHLPRKGRDRKVKGKTG